jgi:hypothetical protein
LAARRPTPTAKDSLVTDALDEYVSHIEEPRLPDGKYHPSSFWMCGRATILAVKGVDVSAPPDKQAMRTFRIGHILHQLTQEGMSHAFGGEVYHEFLIDVLEWNMVGQGDTLWSPLGDGDFEVVEIKSTKSLYHTPKEDHLKQASIYAVAAHDFGVNVGDEVSGDIILPPLGRRLKGVRLVYENKIDMDIKEYWYPYRTAWRDQIEKRVKELDHYRLMEGLDELPPALPLDKGKPSWYHNYCPYRGSGYCCADELNEEVDDEW